MGLEEGRTGRSSSIMGVMVMEEEEEEEGGRVRMSERPCSESLRSSLNMSRFSCV